MPGQGASRGMHCRPPEAEQRILAYSAVPAGESCPQTNSWAGQSRLLQRNATLTTAPLNERQTAKAEPRNTVGEGRRFSSAKSASGKFVFCSNQALALRQDEKRTKMEINRIDIGQSSICRAPFDVRNWSKSD